METPTPNNEPHQSPVFSTDLIDTVTETSEEMEKLKDIIEITNNYVAEPNNTEMDSADLLIFVNALKILKLYMPLEHFDNDKFLEFLSYMEEESKHNAYSIVAPLTGFNLPTEEQKKIKSEMAMISNMFETKDQQDQKIEVPPHVIKTIEIAHERGIELVQEIVMQHTLRGVIGDIQSDALILIRGTIANINQFMNTIEEPK